MVGKIIGLPASLADFGDFLKEEGYLTNATEGLDFVISFVRTIPDVDDTIPAIYELSFDGLLWMVYPKKTSGIGSELNRDFGWKGLNEIGYQGVAMVSLNDSWSAFRFRSTSLIKSSKH